MKLIDRIEVKFFRSLNDVVLSGVNHLNIISGKNDSGKSNVLRALELFFDGEGCDFENDFSKHRLTAIKSSIKGKQFISISVTFNTPPSYKMLPKKVKLTKTWDREGDLLAEKDNLSSLYKQKKLPKSLRLAQSSFTKLLNKIRFVRIPAIRDERFYKDIIYDLQQALLEEEARKAARKGSTKLLQAAVSLNDEVAGITNILNSDFERVSGISSNLRLPTNFSEIFERLVIDTKLGEHDVPLRNRGDGIQMRYIPTILDYITRSSSDYFIWAFDEPENSCEYGLAHELAKEFVETYSKDAQIFISSHSFNFLSIRSDNTSTYRAVLKDHGDTSIIDISKHDDKAELQAELGFIHFSEKMNAAYEEWKIKSIEHDKLAMELQEHRRPTLLFEGKSDAAHFELAYRALYDEELTDAYAVRQSGETTEGRAEGAHSLNKFLKDHVWRAVNGHPLICVFDADHEGLCQLKGLEALSYFRRVEMNGFGSIVLQHTGYPEVFAMSLAVPEYRGQFVDVDEPKYSYLSTELLYQDSEISAQNRDYPTKHDQTVFGFGGRKMRFLRRQADRAATIDFSGFEPSFDLVDALVDNVIQ